MLFGNRIGKREDIERRRQSEEEKGKRKDNKRVTSKKDS